MSMTLNFTVPPHGLAPHTAFELRDIDGATGLYALESVDEAGIRLFVLDTAVYLPDYSPVISDEDCASLDVFEAEQALLLVVANPGDGETTMNLLAPIVVNAATGASAQIILDGQDFPLRARLAARAS
jgi:flagellar assembly factor FliW